MQYIIELVGVSILADAPFLMQTSKETTEFVFPAADDVQAGLRLVIRPVDVLPEVTDVRYTETKRIYVGDGKTAGIFFCSYPDQPPYAFVSRRSVQDELLTCEYIPGNEKYMNYARNLISLMDIEATLLDFGALTFHASLIRHEGCGIIFSAPSGTGKSTQADLWKKYEDADVLNGDRAALRKIDGVWTAFGLPYAGTSGIYRNESAPMKAIVALRQAKKNRIRKIRGAEAFKYLYPETMIHRWDPTFEKKATELLLMLLSEIPVFLLECRPDQDAVELLKDTLNDM